MTTNGAAPEHPEHPEHDESEPESVGEIGIADVEIPEITEQLMEGFTMLFSSLPGDQQGAKLIFETVAEQHGKAACLWLIGAITPLLVMFAAASERPVSSIVHELGLRVAYQNMGIDPDQFTGGVVEGGIVRPDLFGGPDGSNT